MPLVMLGQAVGSTATRRVLAPSFMFWRRKGKAMPPKLEPPPTQPITMSGFFTGQVELLDGLFADDRLVHEHVIEHAAQGVLGVVVL